jgi:hypothetical protein
MKIVVPHRTRMVAMVVVIGSLAVGCTSNRKSDAPLPGASSASNASAPGTSTPDAATTTTVPPVTDPPTTVPPTTAAPTTTTLPPTTTTTSPPTTTTAPLITEGAVVRVANATTVPGGAGRLSNELSKVGYQTAAPTNAAGNEEFLDVTKVYFLPPGEAVATGLAAVLGVTLARMPTPAPITDATAGLGDATVLVMLGKDLAGKTPPGLKGR